MEQFLEQLYKVLNQEKEVLGASAIAVADSSNVKNPEQHIERLIDYNFQKGRTSGIEDIIQQVEKMVSGSKTLKVI